MKAYIEVGSMGRTEIAVRNSALMMVEIKLKGDRL
jgi:hypothetical protein